MLEEDDVHGQEASSKRLRGVSTRASRLSRLSSLSARGLAAAWIRPRTGAKMISEKEAWNKLERRMEQI